MLLPKSSSKFPLPLSAALLQARSRAGSSAGMGARDGGRRTERNRMNGMDDQSSFDVSVALWFSLFLSSSVAVVADVGRAVESTFVGEENIKRG